MRKRIAACIFCFLLMAFVGCGSAQKESQWDSDKKTSDAGGNIENVSVSVTPEKLETDSITAGPLHFAVLLGERVYCYGSYLEEIDEKQMDDMETWQANEAWQIYEYRTDTGETRVLDGVFHTTPSFWAQAGGKLYGSDIDYEGRLENYYIDPEKGSVGIVDSRQDTAGVTSVNNYTLNDRYIVQSLSYRLANGQRDVIRLWDVQDDGNSKDLATFEVLWDRDEQPRLVECVSVKDETIYVIETTDVGTEEEDKYTRSLCSYDLEGNKISETELKDIDAFANANQGYAPLHILGFSIDNDVLCLETMNTNTPSNNMLDTYEIEFARYDGTDYQLIDGLDRLPMKDILGDVVELSGKRYWVLTDYTGLTYGVVDVENGEIRYVKADMEKEFAELIADSTHCILNPMDGAWYQLDLQEIAEAAVQGK